MIYLGCKILMNCSENIMFALNYVEIWYKLFFELLIHES